MVERGCVRHIPRPDVERSEVGAATEHVGEVAACAYRPVVECCELGESRAAFEHVAEVAHIAHIPRSLGAIRSKRGNGGELAVTREHVGQVGNVARLPAIDAEHLDEGRGAVEEVCEAGDVRNIEARTREASESGVTQVRCEKACEAICGEEQVSCKGFACLCYKVCYMRKACFRVRIAEDLPDQVDPWSGIGRKGEVRATCSIGADGERTRVAARCIVGALDELPPEILIGVARLCIRHATAVDTWLPGVGDVVAQVEAHGITGGIVATHEVFGGAEPCVLCGADQRVGNAVSFPSAVRITACYGAIGKAEACVVKIRSVGENQRVQAVETIEHVLAACRSGCFAHVPARNVERNQARAVRKCIGKVRSARKDPVFDALERGDVAIVRKDIGEVGNFANLVIPVFERARIGEVRTVERVRHVGHVAGIPATETVQDLQLAAALEDRGNGGCLRDAQVRNICVCEVDIILEPHRRIQNLNELLEVDVLDHRTCGCGGVGRAFTQNREPRHKVVRFVDGDVAACHVDANGERLLVLIELPPYVGVALEDVTQNAVVEVVDGRFIGKTGTFRGGAVVTIHEVFARTHPGVGGAVLADPSTIVGGVVGERFKTRTREFDLRANREREQCVAAIEHASAGSDRACARVPTSKVDGDKLRVALEQVGEIGAVLGVEIRAVEVDQRRETFEPVCHEFRCCLADHVANRRTNRGDISDLSNIDDRLTVHQLEPGQVGALDACDAIVARFTGLEEVSTDGERLLVSAHGVLPPGVIVFEATTTISSGEGVDRIAAINVGCTGAVALLKVGRGAEPWVVRLRVGALPHAIVVATAIETIDACMVGGAHKENDIFSKGKRAQSVAAFEHATDLQIASITLIAH